MKNFSEYDLCQAYKNQDYIKKRGLFFKNFSNKKFHLFDLLLKMVPVYCMHACKFLDVGCGTGALLKKMKEKFPSSRCLGIDICKNKDCENAKGIEYVIYDGTILPNFNTKFDVVFCTNMLYHVKNKKQFLLNLSNFLSEDGCWFISTKSRENLPALREIHLEICGSMNLLSSSQSGHVDSFCSENGKEILQSVFSGKDFIISPISLMSTVIVDDMDALLSYVLSMPLWPVDNKEYIKKWKEKIKGIKLFFDQQIETIYYIRRQV